uniref:Copper transport protein n=1 Tax=Salix viminalis TaxID=40686 RepID=A0A6N2L1J3_SALVM
MYFVALLFVFVLSILVEWLSHCRLIKPGSNHVAAGLVQTLLHALRVGLAYMVMLAIMSFNGGVFLVAVAGHALGFLFFGSRVFKRTQNPAKTSDLPPASFDRVLAMENQCHVSPRNDKQLPRRCRALEGMPGYFPQRRVAFNYANK